MTVVPRDCTTHKMQCDLKNSPPVCTSVMSPLGGDTKKGKCLAPVAGQRAIVADENNLHNEYYHVRIFDWSTTLGTL